MQNILVLLYVYLSSISLLASYSAYCMYNEGAVFLIADAVCSHPASHISDSAPYTFLSRVGAAVSLLRRAGPEEASPVKERQRV